MLPSCFEHWSGAEEQREGNGEWLGMNTWLTSLVNFALYFMRVIVGSKIPQVSILILHTLWKYWQIYTKAIVKDDMVLLAIMVSSFRSV